MLYRELLDIEINLQDALLNAKKQFIAKIAGVLEEMKELTRAYINNEVLVEIEQFSSKFVEEAIKEKERTDILVEMPDFNEEELIKDGMEEDLIKLIILSAREDLQNLL
jgi:hypothetical protein